MSRRPPLPRFPDPVAVTGFAHGGEGVARVEGKAVFVPGALPGEVVRIEVVDDRRSWARATLADVVEASPDRVDPPCPYAFALERTGPFCGGCDLQHARPEAQRRLKTRVVREQLARLGGVTDPPVSECRAVGPDTGYRNHAQFHAAPDGRLGFHRSGSHDVVPVDRCLVLGEAAQTVRDELGDATGAAEVAVRAHPATGSAAAVVTPGPGGLELPGGDFDLLLRQPDGEVVAMRGDGVLEEEVAGLRFRFGADAFFQVNTAGAAALVEQVLAACGELAGALVWDLYAGVGLFSLPLTAAGAEVVTVEGQASAAEWAERNAESAGLELLVEAEPVEEFVGRAAAGRGGYRDPPDVVVLDPPRTGAGEQVCRQLAGLLPGTIVYVACDVAALARDTRALTEAGYRLVAAQPLDLFPHTHHVEVVATFRR